MPLLAREDHLICDLNSFPPRAVLRGHSSYITHLDFSADSGYLQSNCGAYELLFWDVKKATQIKSATSVRDVEWASWSLVIGWPVQVRMGISYFNAFDDFFTLILIAYTGYLAT